MKYCHLLSEEIHLRHREERVCVIYMPTKFPPKRRGKRSLFLAINVGMVFSLRGLDLQFPKTIHYLYCNTIAFKTAPPLPVVYNGSSGRPGKKLMRKFPYGHAQRWFCFSTIFHSSRRKNRFDILVGFFLVPSVNQFCESHHQFQHLACPSVQCPFVATIILYDKSALNQNTADKRT